MMDFFKKHDSFCLYGTGLKKGDVITIGAAHPIPNDPKPDDYVVYKVYRFTIFHRILEFFGKPFEYHNCVRLRRIVPAGEQKHANIPYDNMQIQ